MKLVIFSDSHKYLDYMIRAVQLEQPDEILHLGDHDTDALRLSQLFPEIPLLFVSGNCDFGASPLTITDTIEGVKIFMTHGHTLGVKYGLLRAELTAREANANLFLFGHTHQSCCDWHNGLWMLNPGTCSGRGLITYGVVELSQGSIKPCIKQLDKTIGE